MNIIEKLKLTKTLAQARAEVNSLAGDGPLVAMKRLKLVSTINAARIALGAASAAVAEQKPAAGSDDLMTLKDVAAGKYDSEGLSALYGRIAAAVHALNDAGLLNGEAESAANDAITRWAEIEERADV